MSVDTDAGAIAPANDTPIAETTTTEAAKPAPSLDETLAAAYDKIASAPDRWPNGQFKPGENATAEPEQPEAQAEGETTDQTAKVAAEPAPPAIDPPISWSADMKAKFGALPPEVQQYVAQRDKETHDAISRFGQERKSLEEKVKGYEVFDQLIESNRQEFTRRGVTPAQAFAVLLDAQKRLDSNPWDGLVQIARSYNIDLQSLIQGQQQGIAPPQQPGQTSPEVTALMREVSQLKSYLTEQERKQHESRQQAQANAEDALTSQIAEFSKDKPHFASVESDILDLIPVFRAKTPNASPIDILGKAYESAIWANPDVRQRILEDQRKADEAKRHDEAVKKAAEAKKMANVNVKSGDGKKNNPKSWTDTLEDTAARLYGT